MAEEDLIPESDSQVDYLEALKELKKNSVDREKYDQLKEENKRLLQTLIDGGQVSTEGTSITVDKNQLRKELYGEESDLSNLEYVTKTLQLRQAIIDEGGVDPFLPNGTHIRPTQQDIEAAERVAHVMQECIDYAEGDSELFTQELMRRTSDVKIRR